MTKVVFDTSLPTIVETVAVNWGANAVGKNLFLRDAAGRLSLVALEPDYTGSQRAELSGEISKALGPYSDLSGLAVATPDELFDDSLVGPNVGLSVSVETDSYKGLVRILDRRVVGADWLRPLSLKSMAVPVIVFLSLKGGVGRSTALCVLASHLANQGRRVLAVDLDLEAPGLGSVLLTKETLPKYGILDYLVESGLNNLDDLFESDMSSASWLGDGHGVINVIPALGKLSSDNPDNVLSKLARAYLPQSTNSGEEISFADRIETLLEAQSLTKSHDVILIDSRAGLHETTAATAAGLGGDVLLFGIDQPQTYAGYEVLFAQLNISYGSTWWPRAHFVEARVGPEGASKTFLREMRNCIRPKEDVEVKESGIPLDQLRGVFNLDWSDDDNDDLIEEAGDFEFDSTFVYDSEIFRAFDPLKKPALLSQGLYEAIFGEFLQSCSKIIEQAETTLGDQHG